VPEIPFPHVTSKAIAVDGGIRPGRGGWVPGDWPDLGPGPAAGRRAWSAPPRRARKAAAQPSGRGGSV